MIEKIKGRSRLLASIVALSTFIIVFVGYTTNPETGVSSIGLSLQGVQQFRMWLDVAGWVKLTYKIDYSKYEQLYTNPTELDAMKTMAERIVLNNIDSRISKLGVSDYNSYSQILNGEDYIVIEIGGISNIDQAKELIGKTVELEFKLQNTESATPEGIAQRKEFANQLISNAVANPDAFSQLAVGRSSEDIYTNTFSWSSLAQLPEIYAQNTAILDSLKTGEVYKLLLEGLYMSLPSADEQWNPTVETLNGYTIVKLLDRKTVELDTISPEKIASLSRQFSLPLESSVITTSIQTAPGNVSYDSPSSSLLYNSGTVFSGETASDVVIYRINKPVLIWKSSQELESAQLQFKQIESQLISSLNAGQNASDNSGATMVFSWWTSETQIQTQIKDYKAIAQWVQSYDQSDALYVVQTNKIKKPEENAVAVLILSNVTPTINEQLQQRLTSETLYSIQDIFIRDKSSRKPARDTKTNQVLNGAFFFLAKTSTSQAGKPTILIDFNDQGKEIFCNISEQNIGKPMAIFVWWVLQSSPIINEKICGGSAQIDGNYTPETANEQVDALNEWAMPVQLILAHEEKVSAMVWENALRWALIAGIASLVILFVMMSLMYRSNINYAIISLLVIIWYLVVLWGLIKTIDYALSLSGIAAIILSIGMGIDACILIFERIKEELSSWKPLTQAIIEWQAKSRSAILDGNISTWLIWLVLYLMGTNVFKWFGAMMIINTILILLFVVPLTTQLLLLLMKKTPQHKSTKI